MGGATYEHLTSHEETERDMLVEYQQAAAESSSPAFRYLASLIVEDEIRHHRIFRELAETLRADAEMRPDEPSVPRLQWGDAAAQVVELSSRLLAHEKADAKALRDVEKELSDLKDTTLWHLLVKVAEMDTAKHIMILEFAGITLDRRVSWAISPSTFPPRRSKPGCRREGQRRAHHRSGDRSGGLPRRLGCCGACPPEWAGVPVSGGRPIVLGVGETVPVGPAVPAGVVGAVCDAGKEVVSTNCQKSPSTAPDSSVPPPSRRLALSAS